jgi:hypothetical protein
VKAGVQAVAARRPKRRVDSQGETTLRLPGL